MRHADGHEHYPYEGIYRGKKQVWHNNTNIAAGLEKCYTTDLWTAYAKKWITDHEQKNAAQPFFLFLAYDAPHAVLELPTGPYPAGKGLKGGLQWPNKPGQMINSATGTADSYFYPEYGNAVYDDDQNPATPDKPWPDTYKRYATAARRIDDGIGDIMQLLKDLKIDENTLIVFASDNGPSIESYLPKEYVPYKPTFFSSYGPFDGIKRDCWEGGVRMPSIASWPKHIKAGKQIDVPSMLSDWAATFADIAQIPKPERMDGVSLAPSLLNKGVQEKGQVYVEYFEGGKTPSFNEFETSRRERKRDQMQMIRFDQYAGVRYQIKSADDDFEIYDVIKDPKETNNLGNLPAFAEMQTRMKAKTLQMHKADTTSLRPYDKAPVPAVQTTTHLQKGINWQFFQGNFPWVVSEKGLKTVAKGRAATLSETVGPDASGMILFEGYINVPADGEYLFTFSSTQKAYIRLHETELFDADYGYRPGTALTHTVYLKAGYHPLKVYQQHKKGEKASLDLNLVAVSSNNQSLSIQDLLFAN
jgi:arylsulfatase A-like enzyme